MEENGDPKVMHYRIKNLEAFMEDHKAWHDKQIELQSSRRWQLLVGVVLIGLTQVAILLISLIKA